VKEGIPDPFWKAPKCPCEYDGEHDEYECQAIWRMDDGSCLADTFDENDNEVKYYPMPALVEPRCQVPEGAPNLVSGVFLGCSDTEAFTSTTTCPDGNVCNAPTGDSYAWLDLGDAACPTYNGVAYDTPWITYKNKMNCVCGGGRFADEYESHGVGCDDGFSPAP
jgi:hypothetical protein